MIQAVEICEPEGPGWGGSLFGIIIGIVILALLIIALLILIDRPINNVVIYDASPQFVGNNNTTGASTDGVVNVNNATAYNDSTACLAGPTRNWVTNSTNSQVHSGSQGTCACVPPFYESQCFTESYVATYLAVGNPIDGSLELPATNTVTTDRLSFPFQPDNLPIRDQTLCTELCDQNSNCTGILWDPPSAPIMGTNMPSGQCTLLLGQIFVKSDNNIPYQPLEQSTLFLKRDINDGAPLFQAVVFLYSGELALRYWLTPSYNNNSGQLNSFPEGILIAMNFRPTNIVNNTGFYGIFNVNRFGQQEAEQVLDNFLSGGNIGNYVVTTPQEVPSIPAEWLTYFGMYIPAN